MERYNFRPILELNNVIASSSFFYRVLKWEDCFEWKLLETSKKLEDLCCYGRIHSFLFHFWFGQWKASLHLSVMFLAAMECQALRWIMKALIETYSGPGICKSRGNVQTEWWLSYWIYYSRVKKHMSPIINNNTQIQGVHQGTPTENENFLKLQNVLALVQDNL